MNPISQCEIKKVIYISCIPLLHIED